MNSAEITKLDLYDNDCIVWQHDGHIHLCVIHQDEHPEPLITDQTGSEDLVKMALWHRNYTLGHTGITNGFNDPQEFWQYMLRQYRDNDEFSRLARAGDIPNIAVEPSETPSLFNVYASLRHSTIFGSVTKERELLIRDIDLDNFDLLEELSEMLPIRTCIELLSDVLFALPVWVYEHSGMSVSCGERVYPYNDRFDSGLLGYAYCFKEDIEAAYGKDVNNENWTKMASGAIGDMVRAFDQWLNNDIYWYEKKLWSNPDTEPSGSTEDDVWDDDDACGGFYGTDIFESGLIDAIGDGFKEAILSCNYKRGEAKTHTVAKTTYEID